ncbi:MAG: 4Fe-4S binding protein [Phycisphaerae bacterium]
MMLQILRRSTQGLALLLMAGMAVLSLYAHYRSAGAIDDAQLMAGMRGEVVTTAIYPLVERLEDPQAFLDGNKGTIWSMRLMGVSLTDPLAAVETMAASKHIHGPLILSVLIPIGLTLIVGKVFCSWICPGYVLFELAGKLRKLLKLAEIQPGNVRFAHANKYLFLVVGVALAAIFSAPLFALIYPPAVISRTIHAWVFGTSLTGMVILLAVIVAFEVFVSPRWWCQTMCPGGALYGLLGWKRRVRIKLDAAACTGCKDCIPVCEAGINPITQSTSIECDNCGVCIRHCSDRALYYTIAVGKKADAKQAATSRSRSKRQPVVAAVAGILAFGALAAPAMGHHILGLPHYSYKENYPQRPTLEYPATTGPLSVLLTSYPGVPVPGQPANLAFYIKDRQADRVYSDEINVRILQTSTFGANKEILPPTPRDPMDHEYKYYVTFPVDGEYIIELSLPVEGRVEVIPFLMVVGAPSSAISFVLAGLGVLLVAFIVVRAVQVKRRRASAARSEDVQRVDASALCAAAEGVR